jgi:hypothetical protein
VAGTTRSILKDRITATEGSNIKAGMIGWIRCEIKGEKPVVIDGISTEKGVTVIPTWIDPKVSGRIIEVPVWNTSRRDRVIDSKEMVFLCNEDIEEIPEDEDFSEVQAKIGGNNKRRAKVWKLLRKYRGIFREKTRAGERWVGDPVGLRMKRDWTPQQDRLIPRRPEEYVRIQKEVDGLLDRDLVKKKDGPWRANTLLLKKKDGTTRFAIDYRKLNTQSEVIVFPMPLMQEIISNLNGIKFMSKVDFTDGFWAIRIDKKSREYTGFATREGQYQWKVCPQGYAGSPAIFQKAVFEAIGDAAWKYCMPYIDDVIIYSKSFKEHLRHLEAFFQKMKAAGFFLKLRKCEFLMEEMEYLGHQVSLKGVAPSSAKVEAVKQLPEPKNGKGVKRFLGLGSYYRKFIPGFASRTGHLRKLTRNNVKFVWDEECRREMQDIKEALASKPVIAYPDWELPFVVTMDASKKGLGAVLSQRFPEGERVVEYASRGLQGAEVNYGISELECLAVIWAVEKFKMYLSKHKFELITDHRALKSLKTIKSNNPRLFRWSLKLAEMDYEVVYRPGKDNLNADPLSRDLAGLVYFIKEQSDEVRKNGQAVIDFETGEK